METLAMLFALAVVICVSFGSSYCTGNEPWTNVALSSQGATCQASSERKRHGCTYAIDGMPREPYSWATNGEGEGAWLQIKFSERFRLTYARFQQRLSKNESFKDVYMTFDGGVEKTVRLTQRTAEDWRDSDGAWWDEFKLENIYTSQVNITALSHYTAINNGFLEVEFYIGKNPCPANYTYLDKVSRCYRHGFFTRWDYYAAQDLCRQDSADLLALETSFERDAVYEWFGKSHWYGYNRPDSLGKSAWTSSVKIDGVRIWPNGEAVNSSWLYGGRGEDYLCIMATDKYLHGIPADVKIGIFCEAAAISWVNVALSSVGATCQASSNIERHPCSKAIDGMSREPQSWATNGEGEGAWLQITFNRQFRLTYARFQQRLSKNESFQDISMVFDGGVTKMVQLTQRIGDDWRDSNGSWWDAYILDDIYTSQVNITALSHYTTGNNGFLEVEFYIGENPCPANYTYLDKVSRCYRHGFFSHWDYYAAQDFCQREGAELLALETSEEREAVYEWFGKSHWYGYNHPQQWGKWAWTSSVKTVRMWPNGEAVNSSWLWGRHGYDYLGIVATDEYLHGIPADWNIGIFCEAGEMPWVNVALSSRGATCQASSTSKSHPCTNAIDGMPREPSSWATNGEGEGAWLQITFGGRHRITYARFQQRLSKDTSFKVIQMDFDDGMTKIVRLTQRIGDDWRDSNGSWWDEYYLKGIMTSQVSITALSHYTMGDNGFLEVEFYTGRNPCPANYTYLDKVSRCYRHGFFTHWDYYAAQDFCQREGAELLALETSEERDAVYEWFGKSHWYGYNHPQQWGKWAWTSSVKVDGVRVWPNGEPVDRSWLVGGHGYDYLGIVATDKYLHGIPADWNIGIFCEADPVHFKSEIAK